MQNIGLNTEQPYKSGHSLWFQSSKLPLSWGFQDNLSKSTGRHTLGKQPVNLPSFEILTDPRTEKAAGLVHLDARWYNPYTSRFTQPDLWNFASTGLPKEIQHEVMQFTGLNTNQLLRDPGQQMQFGYVQNSPLSWVDPFGFASTNCDPLKETTTNPNWPTYETEGGTTVATNGPQTVIPSGTTADATAQFADNTGLDVVVVTGGSELTDHSPNSFHYTNSALDVAGPKFNDLSDQDVLSAAQDTGFTHVVYEDFPGENKDHWHLQIGAGNGLDDSNLITNDTIETKKYD